MLRACCSTSCDVLRACASNCKRLLLAVAGAGVPIRFAADWLQAAVPKRCWARAHPGFEPLLLSIGRETSCPWLPVPRWSYVLLRQIHAEALVLLD